MRRPATNERDEQGDRSRTEATLRSLGTRAGRLTLGRDRLDTQVPGLSLTRREAPTEPEACMYEPRAALIVQGRKRVVQGGDVYEYAAGQVLLASVDLPALPQIVDASPERPYLSLTLGIDQAVIVQLMADADLPAPSRRSPTRGIAVADAPLPLLDAFSRLLDLLDAPGDIAALAPLIQREIHYRLLTTGLGDVLRQVAAVGSQSHRIARAVAVVKSHYREPLRVEALAERVGMSTSTFHQHFRALTGMTPLQYQKWMRLEEARRLMLTEGVDAATAGYRVGYESPSQFSREYRRRFGAPPAKHVRHMLGTT